MTKKPADGKWDANLVAERLEEAASILRRLPSGRPQGYKAFWPQIIHDAMEAYGYNEAVVRREPPSSEEIARMDEALEWLRWVEQDQLRIVWMHAERVPRKIISARLGLSRTTAWRLWMTALTVITTRLNLLLLKKTAGISC